MYYCTVYQNLAPSPSIDVCLGKKYKNCPFIPAVFMLHNVLMV